MVDNGDVPAKKVRGVYLFAASDLEALRSSSPPANGTGSVAEPSPDQMPSESASMDEPATPGSLAAHEPDSSRDGEISATVFADLNAGKDLRTIVVERKLPPEVVHRWYQEWLRCAQIDGLKVPATERRIFALERMLEVHKKCADTMFEEIQGLRERVVLLEQALQNYSVT
ncbi:MAG: hypothetical protein JXP73_14560 [Deltaproteobacteria bacterium]|nr:hypothetical protein [Deltaproteobacteria bacterium]